MAENTPLTNRSELQLEWTGERFVPSLRGGIYFEHIHRYAFANQFCEGKACLDIASGEGFGANVLAITADYVWGVDIDERSVAHANQKYGRKNLTFLTGSATSIPLKDKSVDVVTSFETIEHLADHDKFMQEITRVLKDRGCLIISSPDKREYADKAAYANPYHQSELYHQEFYKLLKNYFSHVLLGKQKLSVGSCITPDREVETRSTSFGFFSGGLSGTEFVEGMPGGLYSIAICGNAELPEVKYGIFEDSTFIAGSEAIDSRILIESLQAELASLKAEAEYLGAVVQSAQKWQERSWLKRAFHRWRLPQRK